MFPRTGEMGQLISSEADLMSNQILLTIGWVIGSATEVPGIRALTRVLHNITCSC